MYEDPHTFCEAHRTAIMVSVQIRIEKPVQLEDMLGVEMIEELREVLNTHGIELGWRSVPDQPGVYVRQIAAFTGVTAEIDLNNRIVEVKRIISARQEDEQDVTQRETQRLRESGEVDNALHQLFARCYDNGIKRAAAQLGYTEIETDEYSQQRHTLKVQVWV